MASTFIATANYTFRGKHYRPGQAIPADVVEAFKPTHVREAGRAPAETPAAPPFPDGFPHAALLQKAGVASADAASGMTRDELVALKGIGEAKAADVLAYAADADQ